VTRLGALADRTDPFARPFVEEVQSAGRALAVQILHVDANTLTGVFEHYT